MIVIYVNILRYQRGRIKAVTKFIAVFFYYMRAKLQECM